MIVANKIKKQLPNTLFFVTPGVRASGVSYNDHKRVVTYSEAITAGSNLLVVGRDLLVVNDRIAYAKSIIKQIANAE
jgi:orotidine-5'-phosphate decarboxylase